MVWKDNITEVPLNYQVALKVLDRVYTKLDRTGNLDRYNQVFFEQLNHNIIEEFDCVPKDFSKYIWLPHRPVYKDEDQSTSKIRPVFNCSLKTRKDKPSLNEASYSGVNIMQNMLLMLFTIKLKIKSGDFFQVRALFQSNNKF